MQTELIKQLRSWARSIPASSSCERSGCLTGVSGCRLVARLPGAWVGEQVLVGPCLIRAEVVAVREEGIVLAPVKGHESMVVGAEVRASNRRLSIAWSPGLLGRVCDPHGRPLDGRPPPMSGTQVPLQAHAPMPLERAPIEQMLHTGIRSIDGLLSLGCGQRVGIFSGPGTGKSSLLGQLARGTTADCTVVCLVGERGREVREWVSEGLGEAGLQRSVVVCATADKTAAERAMALPAATALAEAFRRQGKNVLLLVDSLTRHARALREIALSAGELPGRRGYPASVFDRIAGLVERTGNDLHGSITALYTVLTEDDPRDDPLAEEVRGLLDGHIVLNPELARSGCFPAIDPGLSLSRLMNGLVSEAHLGFAQAYREMWTAYEERRDLIAAGAYQAGSHALTDRAQACRAEMIRFLKQPLKQVIPLEQTLLDLESFLATPPA